jgi:carbonic anhydrase
MFWKDLLDRNSRWAETYKTRDPLYFERIAAVHQPTALFIGCSDARVPANLITDTAVGELFVHRNVANQVLPTDASLSAGLQYAVEVLGVTDVIVCGHHACGGCRAALGPTAPAHVEAWISSLRMLARLHREELDKFADENARGDRLVELNVAEQVAQLSRHPSVRKAWEEGRPLRLHGWVYDPPSGLLEARVRVERDGVQFHDLSASSALGAQAK